MKRRVLGLLPALLLLSSIAFSQGASEALESEARKAFRAGKFREAALKFQDAAAAAAEPARRSRMEVQSAWSQYNQRDQKACRDAVRRAFVADPNLEIVPDFFSPEFVSIVAETRRSSKATGPVTGAETSELKRTSAEKLRDGRASELIYDITNIPTDKRDADLWDLLARAYDAVGRPEQAAIARHNGGLPAAPASPASGGTSPLAAVPTPFPASKPVDGSAAELLANGRSALLRGDNFTAQSAANRILEIQSDSSEAYRLLGDAFRARGENAMAEANWRQALRYDERSEAVLITLAEFFLAEKNWDGALEFYRKAAVVNPQNGGRLLALGRKLRSENDNARAKQVYAAAAAAAPSDAAVLTEYASALLAAGDPDTAIDPLMKAALAEPKRALTHANLAAAFRRKGQNREAEREYREALRVEPDDARSQKGLGALLLATGRAADAREPFRAAVAKDAKDPEAALGLARALRQSGDAAGASAALDAAAGLDDAALWNESGAVAYERGRFDEAAKLFEKAYQRDSTLVAAKANFEKAKGAAIVLAALPPAAAAPPKK